MKTNKRPSSGLPQVIRCISGGRTRQSIAKTKASGIEDVVIARLDAKLEREGWFDRKKKDKAS
jgi:hypothetical protein